jgi:hypothetical protein
MALRELDRDPPLHEKAAFLALGLLASAAGATVQLSTERQDHWGVDLFLYAPRGPRLRLDLTEGHRQTRAKKFKRVAEAKAAGRPTSWIVGVSREQVITVATDPCFMRAWNRLMTGGQVSFSVGEICPEHGAKCTLVGKLVDLGIAIVVRLRPDYRAMFGDLRELRARFE